MKRILICRLMVFLTVALVSCSDDTSESIPQNPDKDMYLRVNVPRTYASGADETDSKETVINGIDVLVFAPGTASQSGLFLKSVSEEYVSGDYACGGRIGGTCIYELP